MKETMRKCIKQIKHTYNNALNACDNTVYRYKYRVFFKGYRGLLGDEVRLPQAFSKIKQGFKTVLSKTALVYSKAAIWRTLGENREK